MLVEIKMYANEKPNVKCVRCYSTDGDVLILKSDDIKYFYLDANCYSIQMNDVKCVKAILPKSLYNCIDVCLRRVPAFMIDFRYNTNYADPNTIKFDDQFDVVFLDTTYSNYSKYDGISSINILPTNDDLNFSMKTIDKDHNHITSSICIDSDEFINNPIMPVVPEPTYVSIYDKLDNIEKKLDYIIDKIGG